MLLAVENLSKAYGERELFRGLTFYLAPGQKVALVARNGTGKTSLLRILAGEEAADAGSVTLHPDARVAYLPQEPELDPKQSILEAVLASRTPPMDAVREYEDCVLHGVSGERLDRAIAAMELHRAWDLEALVKQVLHRLDLPDPDRLIGPLSGGERKRVALARVLLQEPDLLILDEPTNHLDLDMVEWLEGYLAAQQRAVLLVTHDRYFLDAVCREIIEIEYGELQRYRGSFAYYLEQKASRAEARGRSIEKAQALYKTELEWSKRMPQARATKSKYRMEAVQELRELATRPLGQEELEIDIQPERLGSKILELHGVGKHFGERRILEPFSYKFRRRDRIGIVGRNGSGKSTLLDLMTGVLEPDSGKVVLGETVVIGHYRQEGMRFREGQRVIEAVRDVAEFLPMSGGRKLTAAQLLERFLFDRSAHYQQIGTLSGGEKRRLYLLTILMRNPNLLILDEPTNDLDLLTLSVLEDFLLRFNGCLVVVSHDRYFMDKLVEHLFVFEGEGRLRDFPGNYSAYRAELDALAAEAADKPRARPAAAAATDQVPAAAEPQPADPGRKTRMGFKEKREFAELEASIPRLEARKAELENLLASGGLGHEELMRLSAELGGIIQDLDAQSDRWLELSEMA